MADITETKNAAADAAALKVVQNPGFWARLLVGLGRVAAGIWVKNPRSQKNIGAAIDVADEVVSGITSEIPPK